MNLPDDEGLSFYIFEEIRDEKEFKIKYRNTLDNLPIDQKIADSIIEEANRSFKYNMDIFNELEGNLIAAIGKVLFRFLLSSSVHFPQYKTPKPSFFSIGSIYSETVDGLLTALVEAILKLFLIDD